MVRISLSTARSATRRPSRNTPGPRARPCGATPLTLLRAAAAVSAAIAMVVISGCAPPVPDKEPDPTTASEPSQPDLTSSATSERRRPSNTAPESAAHAPQAQSPEAVAEQWLVDYRSATWTDSGPSAWIDRVRADVTTSMDARNETVRGGSGGADWSMFVRLRCASTVVDIVAIVPPESPGTATAAHVQVTGYVRTTCTAGPPPAPSELVAMTLVVVTTPHGWRVDQRLF